MVGRMRVGCGATCPVRLLLAALPSRQQAGKRLRGRHRAIWRNCVPLTGRLPEAERMSPGAPGMSVGGISALACLKALRAPWPGLAGHRHYLSRARVLGAQGCAQSLQALPPLLYEAHRRNIASI